MERAFLPHGSPKFLIRCLPRMPGAHGWVRAFHLPQTFNPWRKDLGRAAEERAQALYSLLFARVLVKNILKWHAFYGP